MILLLILVPFWVSIVVRLFAVTSLLSPNGLLNDATNALGLGDHVYLYTQMGTLIGTTMYLLPYMVLILTAGMSAIDPNLMLAAQTMGASARHTFRTDLPAVDPAVTAQRRVALFILGLGFFLVPSILGGPSSRRSPCTSNSRSTSTRWGTASAMGIDAARRTLVCYVGVVRLAGRFGPAGIGQSQAKGVSAELPFRWSPRWSCAAIATVSISIVLLIAPMLLVFPLAVGETGTVVFPPRGFTMRWFGEAFEGRTWTRPLLRSTLVGAATAVLSVAIALVLARVVESLGSPLMRSAIAGLASRRSSLRRSCWQSASSASSSSSTSRERSSGSCSHTRSSPPRWPSH